MTRGEFVLLPENRAGNKKIAVFIFENGRDINTYPYILNAAALLVKNGWRLDVFLNSSMTASETIPGVNFISLPGTTISSYLINAVKYISKNNLMYISFFAYTFEGVVISYSLNKLHKYKTPVVYFSLELIYGNFMMKTVSKIALGILGGMISIFAPKTDSFILNKLLFYKSNLYYYRLALRAFLDIEVFKNNSFIILSVVQDEMRGALLKDEFSFSGEQCYIPNGYIGYKEGGSDFAARKFGIDRNKKIILFAGGLFLGADALELFELSKNICEDYVLFFNIYDDGRRASEAREIYRAQIAEGKLFINTLNLSCAEYDNSSAALISASPGIKIRARKIKIYISWDCPPAKWPNISRTANQSSLRSI